MHDHLREYDADRLLRAFRENAGLPTHGAAPPGGWEDRAGEAHLVAVDDRQTFLEFDADLQEALTAVPGKPLHFAADGVEFAPFYEGTIDAYHSYFRRT